MVVFVSPARKAGQDQGQRRSARQTNDHGYHCFSPKESPVISRAGACRDTLQLRYPEKPYRV
jgi:hypothetical protein